MFYHREQADGLHIWFRFRQCIEGYGWVCVTEKKLGVCDVVCIRKERA